MFNTESIAREEKDHASIPCCSELYATLLASQSRENIAPLGDRGYFRVDATMYVAFALDGNMLDDKYRTMLNATSWMIAIVASGLFAY